MSVNEAALSVIEGVPSVIDGVPFGDGPAHDNAFYDVNAAAYAERTGLTSSPPLLNEFIATLPAGGMVADLGCGAGRDLASLRRAGLRCTGYDLSPGLVSLARARSGVPVVVADIRALRLSPKSLNGVLAIASLLHLTRDEIRVMLARIVEWLHPQGMFLATMKAGRGAAVDREGRGFTYVGADEWSSSLNDAGLDVVRCDVSRADPEISSSAHDWIATLARKR